MNIFFPEHLVKEKSNVYSTASECQPEISKPCALVHNVTAGRDVDAGNPRWLHVDQLISIEHVEPSD